MRGRMSDAPSYAKPVGVGEVMEGGTVCEVMSAGVPRFRPGDIVLAHTGWQTHALSTARDFASSIRSRRRADRAGRARHAGYDRIHRIARDRQTEGRRNGRGVGGLRRGRLGGRTDRQGRRRRVVGIAGGADKCSYVRTSSASTIASITAGRIFRSG
jgi:hypothetical protein